MTIRERQAFKWRDLGFAYRCEIRDANGAPIGQAFDGTPLPAAFGTFLCTGAAIFVIRMMTETPLDPVEAA